MIFQLHFLLGTAGYSAAGLLLGGYMMRYADASELDLAFVFMIQPLTVLLRPIVGARADRFQSHKQLLMVSISGLVLSYLPFAMIPFLVQSSIASSILTARFRFWLLSFCHLTGSFCFCGFRSLGDALAVNYAKRTDTNFTSYRKFGALSFGICGYLLGMINQDWILPDFVPTVIVYVSTMFLLLILYYLWPEEYFVMMSQDDFEQVEKMRPLPNSRQVCSYAGSKLCRLLTCNSCTSSSTSSQMMEVAGSGSSKQSHLSFGQQTSIFLLLMRRDFRLPLSLLFLLYAGLVGYAPQNFVFTYMDVYCHEKGSCNASTLGGLVMVCFCMSETLCYILINAATRKCGMNHLMLLQVSMLSLAIHYYFYGFFLDKLSPYFFLVECLHGLEYSISLSTSVELAYKFANEVELILPELIERGIVDERTDQQLVRVSLMATMSSCFTLAYDGAGTILGSFVLGLIIDSYGFKIGWIFVGSMASVGFLLVCLLFALGRCLKLKPEVSRLKAEKRTISSVI